jgi:arylsulfatase A-like enzyme
VLHLSSLFSLTVATLTSALCLACTPDAPAPAPAGVDEASQSETRVAAAPNVIIVSIDTLRADRLGSWGYERPTSPTIDVLAANGVRFANAQAEAPWTLPSHMTLMSGLFPFAHGTTSFGRRLSADVPTLAELLQKGGYRTFAYTTGGFVGSVYGFGRGFESYLEELKPFSGLVRLVTKRIESLEPEERYFVFLQTFQVHCPYQAGKQYVQQFMTRPPSDHLDTHGKCSRDYLEMDLAPGQIDFLSDMYDAGIRRADAALFKLVAFLHQRRAWRDTVFVLLSDHGDEFGDHGSLGHGSTLYGELLRVPLIILAPGFAPRVVEERVGLVDLMPTLLDLLQLEPPPLMHGRSLVPLLAGEPRRASVADAHVGDATTGGATLRSIDSEGWKLIVDTTSGEVELFDLENDPSERNDIAAAHPARVVRLSDRLDAHFRALQVAGADVVEPTEQNLEQLRALGYLDDAAAP